MSLESIVDWFKGFFDPPAPATPKPENLLCPHCLDKTDKGQLPIYCGSCKRELPPLYVDDCDNFTPNPVQVFGWTGHGKTVFLLAMTLMLDRLNVVMEGFSCFAVTEDSRKMQINVRQYQATGKMPPATANELEETYVMLLEGLQRWNNRALIIRDCAGEVFAPIKIDVDLAPFLLKAQTTFMVISLPDLDPTTGLSMDMLMVSYLDTLVRHRKRDQKRHLVVVLTKADRIKNLPEALKNYLLKDPLNATVSPYSAAPQIDGEEPKLTKDNLQHYLHSMEKAHQAIKTWLKQERLDINFSDLAKRRSIEVRFCLISGLGANVDDDQKIPIGWQPRRVLDPYFWALEFERKNSWSY